jgi:hypothetical protein
MTQDEYLFDEHTLLEDGTDSEMTGMTPNTLGKMMSVG